MIESSGFPINPTELEGAAFHSGELLQIVVTAIPDSALRQTIQVFVPRDGHTLNPGALIAYCTEKMPRYMVPQAVEILDELPKTTSGKVDYRALRRREGL